MTRPHAKRARPPKSSVLIEAEGRILRLEVDPEATGQAASARFSIFVEESTIALDRAEMAQVIARLRGGA